MKLKPYLKISLPSVLALSSEPWHSDQIRNTWQSREKLRWCWNAIKKYHEVSLKKLCSTWPLGGWTNPLDQKPRSLCTFHCTEAGFEKKYPHGFSFTLCTWTLRSFNIYLTLGENEFQLSATQTVLHFHLRLIKPLNDFSKKRTKYNFTPA